MKHSEDVSTPARSDRFRPALAHLENEVRRGRLTRREFLEYSGLALGAGVLAACGVPDSAGGATTITKAVEALTGEVVWIGEETVVREDHFATFPDSIDITRVLLTDQPAMLQKLRTGAQEADLVEANFSFLSFMREFDLIQPIDEAQLTNWDKVLPGFKEMADLRNEQGQLEMIPTFWGTDAIAYNADEVSDEEASTWSVLWNEKFTGRTALRNDAQESLAVIGIYLGHNDPWNQTTEELAASLALLKDNKSAFRTLWNTLADVESLFLNGEVVVAHSWFPIIKTLRDEGMNMKWSHPQEGAIGWIEGQTIFKDAQRPDLAHVLVDYLLSDEYVVSFYEATGYRGLTDKLLTYLPQEKVEELSLDDADALLSSLVLWGSTANLEEYQGVWTRFLSA